MASKTDKIREYLTREPNAKLQAVADACDCSIPMVSSTKRKMKNEGAIPQKGKTRKNVHKQPHLPTPEPTRVAPAAISDTSTDELEALRDAVKSAGGAARLHTILENIRQAGGLDAVEHQLTTYTRLQAIFADEE